VDTRTSWLERLFDIGVVPQGYDKKQTRSNKCLKCAPHQR
jgi:hypothetical protein